MAHWTIHDVPIDTLISSGNIRAALDEERQVALARSIAESGVAVPLIGHYEGDTIVLDDGHCRWDAARRAGKDVVPMLLSDHTPTSAERVTFQLLANTQARGLKVMEHARALNELMQATGWSAAQVSAKLGSPSASQISKLLSLLVCTRDVQDLIDDGRIPMSSAYEIVKVGDAAERERLIREVLEGRLTRDGLAAQTKATRAGKAGAPRKPKRALRERVVFALGQGRSLAMCAPALNVESAAAWLMELAQRIKGLTGNGRTLSEIAKAISESRA